MSETKLVGEPKEIASVKLVNELLVDIMGGLIPGFLFLFTIIIAVVIPVFCYAELPHFLNTNISQGSFWIVSFLALLIAAYVIGHIFYRADIKEPDQEGFKQQQESIIKNELEQILGVNFDMRKDITGTDVKNLKNRLDQEIKHVATDICGTNEIGQYKEKCCLKIFLCNIKERLKQVRTQILKQILKPIGLNVCSIENQHDVKYYYDKIFCNSEDKWEQEKTISDYYELIYRKLKKQKSKLSDTKTFLKIFKTKTTAPSNEKGTEEEDFLTDFMEHFILYCILRVRNETGCAIKSQCNFPYVYYDYYLKKRKENRLLKYVEWCHAASRTKNKINKMKIEIQMYAPNAYAILNKNESHIRMASSSWYVAKIGRLISFITCIISLVLFVLHLVLLYKSIGCETGVTNDAFCWYINCIHQNPDTHLKIYSNICKSIVAFICPLGTGLLLRYIQNKIILFIHYQRLREIYYTLSVYDNLTQERERFKRKIIM